MIHLSVFCRWIIYSYLMFVARLVMCEEFSQCYDDISICLWTDGSSISQSDAESACLQRSNSFLPRIIDSDIQYKLALFRNATNSSMRQGISLGNNGFWIDVRAVYISWWHWIDNSSFAGEVRDQTGTNYATYKRFAVIKYDVRMKKFVFSARRWNFRSSSSYICQLRQGGGASCAAEDLSMNSKCYRKFHHHLSWFNASNDCLSHGGSLAVFTDIGRPWQNNELNAWLNVSGTDKTYWIGLLRPWWQTANRDIQYSKWSASHPYSQTSRRCVIVTSKNYWITFQCNEQQRFICQNYMTRTATTSTTTSTTSTTTTTTPTPTRRSTTTTPNPTLTSPDNTANTVVIAVSVVAVCITVFLIVIAVGLMIYCYKLKTNRTVQRQLSDKRPADDYATLNVETQGHQPQYDVIQLDPRHIRRESDTDVTEYVEPDIGTYSNLAN